MSENREARELARGKFLALRAVGKWEYAARVNASAVVVIVPVTEDGKLLLVEQYRPPVGTRCVELPAGVVGDNAGRASEDKAKAARRELLEETGYEAGEMVELTRSPTSAGLTSERVILARARGVSREGAPEPDGDEMIEVHEVPLAEVPALVAIATCAIPTPTVALAVA